MAPIRPMDAVMALYSDGDRELSEAIIASLSRAIFGEGMSPRQAWRSAPSPESVIEF